MISIGNSAFQNCNGLTSVTIPNSVISIGNSAFQNCNGLTSVTIPNSVISISEMAFVYCTSLTSVTIPNSVTSIGGSAFSGCSGLTSVDIPNSVTSIYGSAFDGCSGLTSVDIPNSVTSIGSNAFSGTAWYNNQPDGLVYAGKVAYKYKGDMPANTSIVLEEGTLGIAGSAFYGCSGLTSVTIPNSVTSIGGSAFYGCSGLTSVTISNSVTSIGGSAFYGCSGLTSITIPNSVTSIGNSAFRDCTELTDLYCFAEEVPKTDASPFYNSDKYAILHVPASSIKEYRADTNWRGFKDILAIKDEEYPDAQKCATPTIIYANGEISFTCETENVEFVYDIHLVSGTGTKVKLTPTVTVSVYATKKNLVDSDKATKKIDLMSVLGDLSGDGKVDATDLTKLIDILLKR